MKILHTADWHMNATLGRVNRSSDICQALEKIAGDLDEHQVDVMLVAGDLFSDRSRPEQIRAAVSEIKRIFRPFLERGGTIVAISGNHDSEIFFETLRDALDLVSPGQAGHNNTDATGRLYVAPNPRLLRLADSDGNVIQFVLMPYPTARCYLRGEKVRYSTIEEKHRAIQHGFTQTLGLLKSRLEPQLPSVLVSHVHVRGTQIHSLYQLTEGEDVIFEPSDIPAHWAYVAYGHIHNPQVALRGAEHIRYSGSIERLDAGERKDEKSVVLFEVNSTVLVAEPTLLPLNSTPLYQIEITDPDAELPHLAERYPDAARALVHYTLHWQPGVHNRDALCRELEHVFPRWYARQFKEIGQESAQQANFAPQRMEDVVGTVRDYLSRRLASHGQRDELFALADELLAEEGWR
jgi:DNA repair protein SbcD/Mre11